MPRTARDRLETYRRRRDFRRTPEPSGSARVPRRRRAPTFVMHKHRASQLHYDFRLEQDGVLRSWAIPKGGLAAPSAVLPGPPRRQAAGGVPAAGGGMSAGRAVVVSGVRVTNPQKVFWPEEGYTKLDLVRFYDTVFPWLGPFLRGRLLTMERCPDGMRGECFYQKQRPRVLPPGTPTRLIRHEDHPITYVVGGRKDTQLFLVNYGCIPIHVWGSRAASPRRPDWVCFDLDPPSKKFADAARAGLRLKEALDALALASFPKTSGGKGLHVFIPIRVGPDADEVLDFAARLAARLAAAFPEQLTTESRIARRDGRVYVDAFRNAYAQTVVSPYSVRRRPGAPVSTPLDWSEVRPTLDPADFTIRTVPQRLRHRDPWADFFHRRQSFGPAMRALARL